MPAQPQGERPDGATVWFQGYLADSVTGDPLTGTYDVVAAIYTLESGGAPVWGPETHNGTQVLEGWFHIELGSIVTPFLSFSLPPYYLQLTVNGEIMSPRQKLASVPSAIRSEDDGDWRIEGEDIYHESGFVNIGTGPLGEARGDRVSGLIVVGTAQVTGLRIPTGAVAGRVLTSDASGNGSWQAASGTIGGGGTAGYVPKFGAATTLTDSGIYESTGRIGIGTTTTTNGRVTIENADDLPTLHLVNTSLAPAPPYVRMLTMERTQPMFYSDSFITAVAPVGSSGKLIESVIMSQGGWSYPFFITVDGFLWTSGGAYIFGGDDAQSPHPYAIRAEASFAASNTRVIDAEFTGTAAVDAVAVEGKSMPQDYFGVGGRFWGGWNGVEGIVEPTGTASYTGVAGAVDGGSGTNYGVYGSATGAGANYGVYGSAVGGSTNWAGYFQGNVRVTGALVNPLAGIEIDHPVNPAGSYLRHANVVSSEMKTIYDGTVTLDGRGEAWVEMPDWFEALNADFRYQLTAVGAPGPNLYVADKISGNRFRIAGGEAGGDVCWMVTGVRRDPAAVERGFEVEVAKGAGDAGQYLDPVAYGASEDLRIGPRDEKEKR